MPLAIATPTLAAGMVPLFSPGSSTSGQAADVFASAYVQYAVAGGIPAAVTRRQALASALAQAFSSPGGGIPLFLQALASFWIGLPVPAQAGAALFVPINPDLTSPQPPDATPIQQANGVAQMMARLTLGAVKVQPFAPGPPVPIA